MLLAVDIGNSNIVIGCIEDDGEIVDIFRMKTDISKTDDEYAVNLDSILRIGGIDREKISGSIISSVVPPLTNLMRSVIRRLTGTTALVVGAGVKTGLNVMIENPASLGADIVAGSVAAMTEYPLPVIVIDMGTATTIVTVDQHGNYIGGAILPGVAISMDALSGGTSQLQRVPIEAPKKCINGITVDAMKSGAGYAEFSLPSGLFVGAYMAVNACGEIYDKDEILAGALADDDAHFISSHELMMQGFKRQTGTNTSIGCVMTNARLTKAECKAVSGMAHDGYARTIKPVHTSADGDTIFFLAKGDVKVSQDALGDLGSYVMAKAINNAVRSAETAYGAKAACDL